MENIWFLIFLMASSFMSGVIVGCVLFAVWLDSRETSIEPIVSEGAQK